MARYWYGPWRLVHSLIRGDNMRLTNEQKRQQSGRDMEESRRASGRKMRDDMRALAAQQRTEKTLPIIPVRGDTPAQRGRADWVAQSTGGGGGGIASPLTEQSYDQRTFHESSVFLSGEFLMGMEIKPVKDIIMTDADSQPVTLTFAEPE